MTSMNEYYNDSLRMRRADLRTCEMARDAFYNNVYRIGVEAFRNGNHDDALKISRKAYLEAIDRLYGGLL